ncbi:DUF1187 family protein [Escherichia albertii]
MPKYQINATIKKPGGGPREMDSLQRLPYDR